MIIRMLALAGIFYGVCAAAASLIAPGTYLVEGESLPNRQLDGNSVIIVAPKGLIVFDTGRYKKHAQQLLDVQGNVGAMVVISSSSVYRDDK